MSQDEGTGTPSPGTPTELPRTSTRRRGTGAHASRSRKSNTRNASGWVLAIAILQLVFGVFVGMSGAKEADAALQNLAGMDEDEQLLIDDERMTVAELRTALERERLQAYVVPIGLGVVFLGLWAWSRKSPLPALSTALGLFVTVHALDAAVDPKQLVRGVIFKVLCIAGLAKGIRSALEQRALELAARDEQAP